MTPSTAARIIEFAEQGMSPKAIADAVGCDVPYVYRALARAGYVLRRTWVRVSINPHPLEEQ